MLFGSTFANFIAFVYHMVFGRIVGPHEYGAIASILSLLSLISAAFTFFGLVIVKFVSSAKEEELPLLYTWFEKRMLGFGFVLGIVIFLVTPILANFLHLEWYKIFLIGPIVFLFLGSLLYRSFLQGLLKFGRFVILVNLELVIRFLVGLVLVILGMALLGIVIGIFFGALISFLLAFYFMKEVRALKAGRNNLVTTKEVLFYAIPVFLVTLAGTSLFTSDTILARHFLPPYAAGSYAALSKLGQIIFFATSPVSSVMFPLVSKKYSRKENYLAIFFLSLLVILAISLGVLFVYTLFPKVAVYVLFGKEYLASAKHLIWFGIFMTIVSVVSLISNFFLAIGKTKVVVFSVLAAIGQIVAIVLFHSSVEDVIKASVISATLFLLVLLLYFAHEYTKTRP